MLRNIVVAIIIMSAIFVLTPNSSAQVVKNFTATLTGGQEVPANGSPATGTGTFQLNAAQTELTFTVNFGSPGGVPLSSPYTVAHFHLAPSGTNGSPVRTMGGPPEGPSVGVLSGTFSGIWRNSDPEQLNAAALAALNVAVNPGDLTNIYFNVHSSAFAGGEIRGQLQLVPEPTSLVLAGVGISGLAWRRWRRRG